MDSVLEQCSSPDILYVFTTDGYDHQEIIDTINSFTGGTPIAGMCAGGVIYGNRAYKHGIVALGIESDEIKVKSSLYSGLSDNPFEVGKNVANELTADGFNEGVISVFPNGLGLNIAEMLRGLYMNLGPDFQYFGGGSGDNLNFAKSCQFTEQGLATDAVATSIIHGLPMEISIGHGWKPYGDPIMITRSEGKKVLEIDGKAAFDAYCDRFGNIDPGQFPEIGMKYPLGFADIDGNYYIRDPLSVNSEDNSIYCVSEVPNNAIGSFMQGDITSLTQAAGNVSLNAKKAAGEPAFALICDCISRYLLMADKFEEELQMVQSAIGEDVPLTGALTFGEVGSRKDLPFFHNKTMVLAVG